MRWSWSKILRIGFAGNQANTMWLSHPFSLTFSLCIRYVVVVAFSASTAFNSAAQTGVVRIPRAPASVILNVPIRTGWNAEFHCNHDDRELICVIANLKHGKEERYPELLIDPQNWRSSNWQRGQWWFHSSYNLCEGNGEFNV